VSRKDREVLMEQRRAEFKNAKLLAVSVLFPSTSGANLS
jgi:hypothetical protein